MQLFFLLLLECWVPLLYDKPHPLKTHSLLFFCRCCLLLFFCVCPVFLILSRPPVPPVEAALASFFHVYLYFSSAFVSCVSSGNEGLCSRLLFSLYLLLALWFLPSFFLFLLSPRSISILKSVSGTVVKLISNDSDDSSGGVKSHGTGRAAIHNGRRRHGPPSPSRCSH